MTDEQIERCAQIARSLVDDFLSMGRLGELDVADFRDAFRDERTFQPSAEFMAERFHEVYERLAPNFGYQTKPESRVQWEKLPQNHRALMTSVCAELMHEPSEKGQSQ